MKEYILKEEVLEIVRTLPSDIVYDHIAELKGIWEDEETGRWIDGENMNGEKFLADIKYCSVCHKEAYWDSERGQQLFPCCPNCGARMESEK